MATEWGLASNHPLKAQKTLKNNYNLKFSDSHDINLKLVKFSDITYIKVIIGRKSVIFYFIKLKKFRVHPFVKSHILFYSYGLAIWQSFVDITHMRHPIEKKRRVNSRKWHRRRGISQTKLVGGDNEVTCSLVNLKYFRHLYNRCVCVQYKINRPRGIRDTVFCPKTIMRTDMLTSKTSRPESRFKGITRKRYIFTQWTMCVCNMKDISPR